MQCDMCGKNTKLFKTLIEGTELNVCQSCAKYGNAVKKAHPKKIFAPSKKFQPRNSKEESLSIVLNYAQIIKQRREKLNLKQDELAKQVNERISIIHKLETSHFRPSLRLARKLERHLKIRLVEKKDIEPEKVKKYVSQELTIGDLIKLKAK